MTLSLTSHVHLAAIGDDVVLLDTTADTYMCIPDGVAILRPSFDRASLQPVDDAVAAALRDAGLVEPGEATAQRGLLCRPAGDIGHIESGRLTPAHLAPLAGALWDLVRRYRGRSLAEILDFVARERGTRAFVAGPDALRLAGVFHRAAVWLPMPRKCLVRSFVLLRFLQRSGLDATWVFGVTTWPFRAHCWLQIGDTALDDNADRIVEYEPILGVG
jgi:hypothetical protein